MATLILYDLRSNWHLLQWSANSYSFLVFLMQKPDTVV